MNVLVYIFCFVLLELYVELEFFNIFVVRCCVQVNYSSVYFRIINFIFEMVELFINFVVVQVVDIDKDNIL